MRKKSTPSCSFYNPCSSYHSFHDNDKSQRSSMYECDLCGKRFNSGAALGGHKTSHRSQPQNKKQRHNHSVNKNDEDDEKQKHSCRVCNKVFSSKQALCGHMRCHKRDGKSIHPRTSSSIDLSKYMLPISHQTNKGSKRNIIDDDVAPTLIQVSHDNNHGERKRRKLSCGDMVNETVKEQTVMLTASHVRVNDETVVIKEKDDSGNKRLKLSSNSEDIVDIDESRETKVKDNNTSIDIEEKKINNEGETEREQSHNELKSNRVVMNFDLNERPMEDVADE
jgi:hypothetical protein